MIVYGMKGDSLWEVSENGRPATDRIGVLSLKVIVYGRKGVNNIEKISRFISYQLSVVSCQWGRKFGSCQKE